MGSQVDKFMGMFRRTRSRGSSSSADAFITEKTAYHDVMGPTAIIGQDYGFRHKPYPAYPEVWDGEKNFGQLGYPIFYLADFRNLAIRSWQSFYESDITQIIINTYLTDVIGSGLSLESLPVDRYIKRKEAGFNRDEFVKDVEMLFELFATDKNVSNNRMQDLHDLAWDAKMNALVGGDVLCIQRADNLGPNIQLIDGIHVGNPVGTTYEKEAKDRGNTIKNGVEIDVNKQHIAYYVYDREGEWQRIKARHSKTGRMMAWLIYGTKARIDDTRGMPLFAAVLEDAKALGRYKEATISTAEERAKVVYTVEHDKDSTEENPWKKNIRRAAGSGRNDGTTPETQRFEEDQAAQKIAMTTNKSVVNLPKGAKLTSPKSENEIQFKDFFSVNFDLVCATLGVPPEVALAKYNSNYSASRAAVKTWEKKVKIMRKKFARAFYKEIYVFWLDLEVLKGNIVAPGYFMAKTRKDRTMIRSFANCEFLGPNMPHVDPLKEVLAVRKMLADDKTPLTTRTKATRALNEGDWEKNIENFAKENEMLKDVLEFMQRMIENNQTPNNGQNQPPNNGDTDE